MAPVLPFHPRPRFSIPLSGPPAHLETLHKYNYCSIRGRVVLGYLSLRVNEFPPSALDLLANPRSSAKLPLSLRENASIEDIGGREVARRGYRRSVSWLLYCRISP